LVDSPPLFFGATMTSTTGDSCIRAITDDGSFRVMVARTTRTVREITLAQKARSSTAQNLGDLLTATVLFRETMAPALRVQGILRCADRRGTLVADSAPEGLTRGLVQGGKDGPILATEGALLQMMRTLHNGSINQGVVPVPPGGGMTEAMMTYMRDSEQVDTMLAVATRMSGDGTILEAGGYMVQLLPEVGRAPLAIMAERLEDFRTIEHLLTPDFSPDLLLSELLYGLSFTRLEQSQLSFSCWCSTERLLAAIATLKPAEIRNLVEDGSPVQSTCDYCGKEYAIQTSQLSGLLEKN